MVWTACPETSVTSYKSEDLVDLTISSVVASYVVPKYHQLVGERRSMAPGTKTDFIQCFEFVLCWGKRPIISTATPETKKFSSPVMSRQLNATVKHVNYGTASTIIQ
jgi:hypothetical protein